MRHIMRLLLVLFCFTVTPIYSQSNYASFSGTVSDPQQKVLAGCSVMVTSETTGALRQTVTNELGSFQITGLLPGDYKVTLQYSGCPINCGISHSPKRDFSIPMPSLVKPDQTCSCGKPKKRYGSCENRRRAWHRLMRAPKIRSVCHRTPAAPEFTSSCGLTSVG